MSQNAPQLLVGAGNVPADQFPGSMGIGYMPTIDVTAKDNPDGGPYSNPQRRACLALMRAHGYTFADLNAKAVGLLLCNDIWFFRQVMTAAAQPVNQATFINAVNHLGTSFVSTTTFGTFFSAAQHDGGGYYYNYAWNAGCGCMRYAGQRHPAIGEGAH
jgi:hypothetical protein